MAKSGLSMNSETPLLRIRGVVKRFGGLQALKKATQEDIAKVEGIGEVLAAHIYTFFHS